MAPLTQKNSGDDQKLKSVKKPSNILPALRRLVIGVICLVLHLQLSARAKVAMLFHPDFRTLYPTFLSRGLYTLATLLSTRFSFYFVWKLAEGASILGGFGFEGYDEQGKEIGWKGVENIDILGFELAPCVQYLSRSWNKRTQGWLERYTYHRSGQSIVVTYFISAIWHGLYPGFFCFFMSVPLLTNIEREIKNKINPIVVPAFDGRNPKTYPWTFVGWTYHITCVICNSLLMSYTVQTFSMYSMERSMMSLGNFNYYGHAFALVVYGLFLALPKPKKKTN